jgi:hypothetical protein
MKNSTKRIQQKAIEHYERMLAYAKTQDPNDRPDLEVMEEAIKETWDADSCPYCAKYLYICNKCALNPTLVNTPDYCCNGLYNAMVFSNTWTEWISYAKKIKAYIKKNG